MKKCAKCSEKGIDTLYYCNRPKKIGFISLNMVKESNQFCRKHMLEELEQNFLQFNGKLVIFHPSLELKENIQYGYIGLDKGADFFHSKVINKKIINALSLITKSCSNCEKDGQVAYYPEGSFNWRTMGKWYQIKWDVALLEEATEPPEILCLECAFKSIKSSLERFKDGFEDGLTVPYGKYGVYFPLQI